jgi:hypothetical protein
MSAREPALRSAASRHVTVRTAQLICVPTVTGWLSSTSHTGLSTRIAVKLKFDFASVKFGLNGAARHATLPMGFAALHAVSSVHGRPHV